MRDPVAHELLVQWRQERALRVARLFSFIGILLSGLTTATDIIWSNYALLPTDLILMSGCALTFLWARASRPPSYFWKPLYLSYFTASLPFYWLTGGLQSPFFALGIALLYTTGEVLDAKGRSKFHLTFALMHIPAFLIIEFLYPLGPSDSLPPIFTAVVSAANLGAVFVCLRALLRTEETLSLKFSERQTQLAEAGVQLENRVEERTLQLEQSLRQEIAAKEQAEKASHAKMQFLANMSHEIRTPLNAVLGFAEILTEDNSPKQTQEFMERIRVNGKQLVRLVDDILDLSKFEEGNIELQKNPVDIRASIHKSIQSLQPAIKAKNLKLELTISDEVPKKIALDESRTLHVLNNLLSNAVKFSDSGTISVRVNANQRRLSISVEDTGIGISSENRENLFEIFTQADSSMVRRHGGSGLGLALSKRISEAMGGTLTLIWSEPRKGSHFLFQVPFEAVNGSQPVRRDSPTRRQSVLLAEDSPDNAFLISHFIESLGYSVHVVSDGVEAVEATRKTEYDTIVMDIQMPRMDGLEATRRIRAHGFKKSIIAVTAHALPEEVERSLAAGCDQHLTKPVSRADLAEALGV